MRSMHRPAPRFGRGRSALTSVTLFTILVTASGGAVRAQDVHPAGWVGGPGSANYRLAARFAPYRIRKLVHSTAVSPRWLEGSERFWYPWDTSEGTFYYIVDPVRATKRQVFDNDRLAAELTRITRDPWDGRHLPIRSIRFIDDNTLQFDVQSSQDEGKPDSTERQQEEKQEGQKKAGPRKKVFHFEYKVDTRTLRQLEDYEAPDDHPSWAGVSPDGATVIFAKHDNLFMMTGEEYRKILDARRGKEGARADSAEWKVEVTETQLTEDGEIHYSYAVGNRGDTDNEVEKKKDRRKRAAIVWSKDSKRFAGVRADQRKVGDLWVIHSTGNKRPELETYRYDMPGEKDVTRNEVWIFDLPTRKLVKARYEPWKDESISIAVDRQFLYPDSREPRRRLWLADNPDELFFYRLSRDRHRTDVMIADAATGQARVLFEDRLNTYMETRAPELLPDGDILWWSERDGWAHLYRYGPDGKVKNQVTRGPFSVRAIEGVDEEAGVVYFRAAGREKGEDPYYEHLYRVNLDGSGLRLLTPGNFNHRVSLGPSNRFFVDNFSRVNTVPAAALHSASGREILPLDTADFSSLTAAGYRFPEPFTVKSADGITDLYGVIYKPFDFDPGKKYPLVEYVYPGPQTEAVAKSFSLAPYETGLSQFGFIVITVGNRGGNPARSKWYHNYGYGNLRDYGLADKKVAAEELAERYDFIDLDRVGIYGHSGGGFMSTAAMLVYPDFFKVAVSSSGNHTNDIYNRWWSETHHGVKEVVSDSGEVSFRYDIAKNPSLAKNLKGHLLLTTGDIDNNVHPANTIRMAEALIKANKRFDFFLFPGQRHGYGKMGDYWFWLRAEYFVKHLLGDEHWNADIVELQVEHPKNGKR